MHARTLTAVLPIRSESDSASLLSVGFGRSLNVREDVNRIGRVGGRGFGMHARTLTAVFPIRSGLDSASLLSVGFGRDSSV